MGVFVILLAASFVACGAASPQPQSRIVGGSSASINSHPEMASLLSSYWGFFYNQRCCGTILNSRSILTAAHCGYETGYSWRIRLGSSYADSGGIVYSVAKVIYHSSYNPKTYENDIAIMRSRYYFDFGSNVLPATLPGSSLNLKDGDTLYAVGWGATSEEGSTGNNLRAVAVTSVNQDMCQKRYDELFFSVTANMLCSGIPDVAGYGQCSGDDGAPLFHGTTNVVVGIYSWGRGCARARYPAINTRVSKFISWINSNS